MIRKIIVLALAVSLILSGVGMVSASATNNPQENCSSGEVVEEESDCDGVASLLVDAIENSDGKVENGVGSMAVEAVSTATA